MKTYNVKSPVLFLIFNRPENTKKVFQSIREAKPTRLFIAADGPRKDKIGEQNLCNETRKIVEAVDWECIVKTLYRNENLGCKYAVSQSITWFFDNVSEGIILEDDCLPSNDFFRFCDQLLEKYREDTRIRFIGGSNFQKDNSPKRDSYYFSNLSHVWGWAGWKRAWNDYDVELEKYKNVDFRSVFYNLFGNKLLVDDWTDIVAKLLNNEIDTWDYQLSIINILNNGLSIIPHHNLISNIGFGTDATHTINSNGFENLHHQPLDEKIIDPLIMFPSKQLDLKTMYVEHNISNREKKIKKRKFTLFLKFWKKN